MSYIHILIYINRKETTKMVKNRPSKKTQFSAPLETNGRADGNQKKPSLTHRARYDHGRFENLSHTIVVSCRPRFWYPLSSNKASNRSSPFTVPQKLLPRRYHCSRHNEAITAHSKASRISHWQ